MISIPSSGFYFTWSNRRNGRNRVNSRLDRGMVNEEWWGLFLNASIELLPQTSFDHNPQVLSCFGQQSSVKRPFWFEAAWVKDQRSFWVVNHAWGEALAFTQLHLEDPGAHERDTNLRYHLNNLLKMEAIHWFQKSRLKWQLEGDQCTWFFFLTTLTRRKFNRIDSFMQRFLSVYDNPDPSEIYLENLITASISNEENSSLIRIPDWDEIRTTIFRMGSFKAAGPDGLPALSWQFLEAVLKAFGFHPKWIHWIVTCCSTPKMTLLLNGAPVRSFFPKRGLRQGDLLSPYLFILCMEVLSRLINKKVADGLISGFKISRHSPALHHLFFADDVFLMGKCSVNEAFYFKECLDDFCRWSGQSFNALKSNIFFNHAASRRTTGLITAMMGFSHITSNSAYLGLPLFHTGHNKDFNFLVEQLDSKLAGWNAITLSKAKKLILIKSIVLAVPTYSMQTVKIPTAICSKLDARIRSFWWGPSSNGRNSLCLKAWDALCKPKSLGGLGFRRMRDFNLALLSKWGWNVLTGQNSFCLSVLRARYLHHTQFFEASSKTGDSKFWKTILSLKELIREGACYVVGDGCSIDPWKYPWVLNIPNFLPIPTSEPSVNNATVKDFFLQQGLWDIPKLALLYSPADVQAISSISLPLRPKPDRWVWTPMSNGKFTTRYAYLLYNKLRFLDQNQLPKEIWLKI
ncbi:hypothetical protein UlMin_044471 [Ulmus minor]